MNGRQIKAMRRNYGVKAIVLAKEAGVHYSRLSLIENEHIEPDEREMEKISQTLSELVKREPQ